MLVQLTRATGKSLLRRGVQVRHSSGIKLLNEKEKAAEDYYFSKQDEKLIKHMIQDSNEVASMSGELPGEAHTLAEKIKLVFMKNGIPPNSHRELVDDLVKLLEASEVKK